MSAVTACVICNAKVWLCVSSFQCTYDGDISYPCPLGIWYGILVGGVLCLLITFAARWVFVPYAEAGLILGRLTVLTMVVVISFCDTVSFVSSH